MPRNRALARAGLSGSLTFVLMWLFVGAFHPSGLVLLLFAGVVAFPCALLAHELTKD